MDRWIGRKSRIPKDLAILLVPLLWDGDPWPFQRLSDLQLVDKKVTLNHLAPVERMESLRCWKIKHSFVGRTFLHGTQTWMFGRCFSWWFSGSISIFWGVMLKVEFQLSILPNRSFTIWLLFEFGHCNAIADNSFDFIWESEYLSSKKLHTYSFISLHILKTFHHVFLQLLPPPTQIHKSTLWQIHNTLAEENGAFKWVDGPFPCSKMGMDFPATAMLGTTLRPQNPWKMKVSNAQIYGL